MDYFLYFYNIILVLVYGLITFLYFQLFSQRKERLYLWIALLFSVYLADELYYSSLEFLDTLPSFYQEYPSIKYIVYFVVSITMLICYRMILAHILRIMPAKREWGFMAFYSLYRLVIIFCAQIPDSVPLWIFCCYLILDLLPYFWFTFLGFRYTARNDSRFSAVTYKVIKTAVGLWLVLCFGCFYQIYFMPELGDREICAEIISIFSVIFAIWHLVSVSRSQKEKSTAPGLSETDLEALFAAQYKLTPREMEIFRYLMEGTDNAGISEKAVISQSTTKTHIYNIFRKVDIKRRSQAAGKFQEFCKDYTQVHPLSDEPRPSRSNVH